MFIGVSISKSIPNKLSLLLLDDMLLLAIRITVFQVNNSNVYAIVKNNFKYYALYASFLSYESL